MVVSSSNLELVGVSSNSSSDMSTRIDGGTQEAMASERDMFHLSGPLHLPAVDWENAHHRRSVAASLVQGVYVLERDRQKNLQAPYSLASPWWEFFNFQLLRQLVDDVDSSIFGAIYEFLPPPSSCNDLIQGAPRYVIAFRGTITKGDSVSQDVSLNLQLIKNGLHLTPRFEIAMQAVRSVVATHGGSNVWIAGHSLGSAMAMLAGRNMAKTGVFLEAFLFNPPFFSAPIERIKNKKVKHGLRIASSFITAGLAVAMKANNQRQLSDDTFVALSAWIPSLFVHPADHICSEYIGYFEHREKMKDIGAGSIERLASRNSIASLFLNAAGWEADPLHLLPSANLTTNLSRAANFKQAHGIHQWFCPDSQLQTKLHQY